MKKKKQKKSKPLFLKMSDVCRMLTLSPERIVTKYIKPRLLKATKTSGNTGHYRIHRDEFDRFVKEVFLQQEKEPKCQ